MSSAEIFEEKPKREQRKKQLEPLGSSMKPTTVKLDKQTRKGKHALHELTKQASEQWAENKKKGV